MSSDGVAFQKRVSSFTQIRWMDRKERTVKEAAISALDVFSYIFSYNKIQTLLQYTDWHCVQLSKIDFPRPVPCFHVVLQKSLKDKIIAQTSS